MKREDIKKAAFNTIDAPCERNCEKCDCKYKEDCIWSHLKDGFVLGAEWRINSVWHSATEKPNGKDAYLVENRFSGKIRYCVWVNPFTPVKNVTIYDTIIRWAYIKDLTPDTEE